MIKAVFIACFFAVALAVPAPEDILNYDAEDHKHSQTGDAGNAVEGSYSFTDAEGKTFTINYKADESGYRATGDHLPVAPEVPAVPEVAAPVPVAVPVAAETKTADVTPVAPAVFPTLPIWRGAFPYGYNGLTYPATYGYNYGFNYGYPFPYYAF